MEPVVVVFAGEYTVASKVRLHRELGRLASKARLVLDFSKVTYVDSTCVAELMRMEQRRINAGFESAFVVMHAPALQRIFAVLTLDRVFRVVPQLCDAVDGDVETVRVEHAFRCEDGVAKVPDDYERAEATG